ncbi:hypothetical protein ACFQ05_26130 [Amycolatopsis umgeniensis]|uniref:Uncharacterized protein n=1 Tax=Amycolatopsis umgeniensis TaxID=336628 RepID=A0A841BCD0_9PSEU|nr:hypothetical protein [Amycolatopsis umgeniensis]MBB5856358.1 hypothetical protein [Amycolatopsis umgeniensis]
MFAAAHGDHDVGGEDFVGEGFGEFLGQRQPGYGHDLFDLGVDRLVRVEPPVRMCTRVPAWWRAPV